MYVCIYVWWASNYNYWLILFTFVLKSLIQLCRALSVATGVLTGDPTCSLYGKNLSQRVTDERLVIQNTNLNK